MHFRICLSFCAFSYLVSFRLVVALCLAFLFSVRLHGRCVLFVVSFRFDVALGFAFVVFRSFVWPVRYRVIEPEPQVLRCV